MSELARVKKSPPNYFKDPWNILDLVTYFVLLIVILMHIVDVAVHTTEIAIWTARYSIYVLECVGLVQYSSVYTLPCNTDIILLLYIT